MPLTKRLVKGQALTAQEHDDNLTHFEENHDGIMLPKDFDKGIKVDSEGTPDWGWEDLKGELKLDGDATDPAFATYQGNIKDLQFAVNDDVQIKFHMEHDYAPGTDLYIHVHWSHNSNTVTTGAVTWQAEVTYAKSFNQMAFISPILVNIPATASTIRYQQMTNEVQLSAPLGAGGLLATEDMEVDALLICRLRLLSNTMDGGALPFMHHCDIHYQSKGVPTKQRAPNFYV